MGTKFEQGDEDEKEFLVGLENYVPQKSTYSENESPSQQPQNPQPTEDSE